MGCGCGSFFLHVLYNCSNYRKKTIKIIPEAKLNAQAAAVYEKVKEKEKMSEDVKT